MYFVKLAQIVPPDWDKLAQDNAIQTYYNLIWKVCIAPDTLFSEKRVYAFPDHEYVLKDIMEEKKEVDELEEQLTGIKSRDGSKT